MSGAVSTTTNVGYGTGACLNGNTADGTADVVNCNLYSAPEDVWTSGLPAGATVEDGTYFFAVIAPGGQANPNDGSPKLLSTDARVDRRFSVTDGQISNLGTHVLDDDKVQLMPYKLTPNPGGVYILAVCQLPSADSTEPVDPSTCKYDAFKVRTGTTPDPGGNNPQPLTVTKDAAGSYTTTYGWGITKDVDKTLIRTIGKQATFNYTVGLTKDAGTISAIKVTGDITVMNPNAFDVEAAVTDILSNGTSCTVSGSTTMEPGDNVRAYSCDLSALPEGELDNTATVTWAEQDFGQDGVLAAGSDHFTFSNVQFAQTVNGNCVDVTDLFAKSGTTPAPAADTLGSTCAAPKSYTYPRTVPVPDGTCVTYDNTATFTTTDTVVTGSAAKSVTVCGPAKTGALTIGFWQNKNGQGIITNGPSTSTVCNSGTWLRQYAPFQDLSATAKCSAVGTYVTNVIKAANASGASMNAMLKAQMLATALDTYFTGAGKYAGAQMFLPSKSIGDQKIDLTLVCKDIASCSAFEDTSSAFGGATQMTVSQLLAYAGSQSNVGGSTWYGQVKATQGLAKDTFDAINNQVAFAP